ncbi:MAG: hypothetical protein M3314_02675 [Actinomycetota bacterium]|nr:hypothetical protein [Actinomycetota bacterium]
MFKRFFWLSLGAMLGLATSFWAQRRLRRAVNRLAPEQVRRRVSWSARTLLDDLRGAADEGRSAMREREASLRAELARRPG